MAFICIDILKIAYLWVKDIYGWLENIDNERET